VLPSLNLYFAAASFAFNIDKIAAQILGLGDVRCDFLDPIKKVYLGAFRDMR
jgi:hypothetical protein